MVTKRAFRASALAAAALAVGLTALGIAFGTFGSSSVPQTRDHNVHLNIVDGEIQGLFSGFHLEAPWLGWTPPPLGFLLLQFECLPGVCNNMVPDPPSGTQCIGTCTNECQSPRSGETCGLYGTCTEYDCTEVANQRCCAEPCNMYTSPCQGCSTAVVCKSP